MIGALTAALAPSGLNLIGVASLAAYDATVPAPHALVPRWPGAQCAIVIGNGGGAFWAAFRADVGLDPEHERLADPLDAFTRSLIEEKAAPVLAAHGGALGTVYPFEGDADPVSFVHLAECAALGRRSLLGVLVHPVFGPWIALRAAIVVAEGVAALRPADGFDPCPSCVERSCIAACPSGAISAAGWDVPRCAAHRARADEACGARCHARFECVLGRQHRYPSDALAYHQERARPALTAIARRS